jgi:hypothetical protein
MVRSERAGARKTRVSALWLAALVAGCGGSDFTLPAEPVTQLVGELHLHQFPLGAHGWVAFVSDPVPLLDVHSDQLVVFETAPTQMEGVCTLYVTPTCTPECAYDQYCYAPGDCRALVPVQYVDGGEVDIVGSRIVPEIRMWWDPSVASYDTYPMPGSALLFAGSEELHVDGGTGDYRLRGTLLAPALVDVLAPDLTQPLRLDGSAPLDVRWTPDTATQMVLTLSASSDGLGGAAIIRCVTSDTGTMTVPASLLAALPPSPRHERFELERDQQTNIKTVRPGMGLLAHAAHSVWRNDTE